MILDTHILIWALAETGKLSSRARDVLEDNGNERLFSAASIWEVAIKRSLGRQTFLTDPGELTGLALESGFRELPVTSASARRVATLPLHHRDPFDRLLVAQAVDAGALLLTADLALAAYAPHVLMLA